MKRGLAAFGSGLLFATGLCVAGMTRPLRILAFLDVLGSWDPSLALVMVGAVAVAAIAFAAAARRAAPVLGGTFRIPERRARVGRRLVTGAAMFGAGWGLSGLCPGPAVVALASAQLGAVVFVGSMVAGMVAGMVIQERLAHGSKAQSIHGRSQQEGPRATEAGIALETWDRPEGASPRAQEFSGSPKAGNPS